MKTPALCAPIAALDLDPIKVKIMHAQSGEGWSLAYTEAVEVEYRRFLHLMKLFPHEQAAPLFDVDVFWHYHILDTMKFAADCQAVFGYFLHHFPYVGLRGEDDLEAHERAGGRMDELYERTYGEPQAMTCPDASRISRSPPPRPRPRWRARWRSRSRLPRRHPQWRERLRSRWRRSQLTPQTMPNSPISASSTRWPQQGSFPRARAWSGALPLPSKCVN